MRRLVFVICGALLLSAQAPNPITVHYNAYRAALATGDIGTAEREAQLAFEASVARDGDGGSTGALAVNLAMVRLGNGHAEAAHEPALRAQTIAQSASGAALDPILISLLLGRAELTEVHAERGRERLLEALAAARGRRDLLSHAFDAAKDLGRWNFAHQQYADAATAWAFAAEFVEGAPGDHNIALANVLTWQGASVYSNLAQSETSSFGGGAGFTGSNIRAVYTNRYGDASAAFSAAIQAVGPQANQNGPDNALTPAQSEYALAIAWRSLINTRLRSLDQRTISHDSIGGTATCPVRLVAEPIPDYPKEMLWRGRISVVVLRLSTDASGGVTDIRVAAALPQQGDTQRAVEDVFQQWRVERHPDAAPGCELAGLRFVSVMFALD